VTGSIPVSRTTIGADQRLGIEWLIRHMGQIGLDGRVAADYESFTPRPLPRWQFQHPVVVPVGDIYIASGVHRHIVGSAKAGERQLGRGTRTRG
jgi:hypothetical protein